MPTQRVFETITDRHGKVEVTQSVKSTATSTEVTYVVSVDGQIVADIHPHYLEFGFYSTELCEAAARNLAITIAQDIRARLNDGTYHNA